MPLCSYALFYAILAGSLSFINRKAGQKSNPAAELKTFARLCEFYRQIREDENFFIFICIFYFYTLFSHII